jgi:hypothetical protein
LESSRKSKNELSDFLIQFENIDTYFLSKSNAFTHIHASKFDTAKDLLPMKDQMLGENIFTLYDDEVISKLSIKNVRHISTAIQTYYRYHHRPICFVHFNKTSILICVCGSVGFKFFNEFEIENAEDILYFTKSTLQTLNIDESEVILNLSGYIEEGYLFYKMLQRYFYQLEMAANDNFKVKDNLGKEHYYFEHFLNISF